MPHAETRLELSSRYIPGKVGSRVSSRALSVAREAPEKGK